MRSAEEWANLTCGCIFDGYETQADFVRAIQQDAYRAGLEAAAKEADAVEKTGERFDYYYYSNGAADAAARIRKLITDPHTSETDGAGDKP